MAVDRRQVLSLAAAAALAPLVPGRAAAGSYPVRPVRVMLGFPPGGGADLVTRIIGEWLQLRLGQAFVVENLPGAGTNLATEAVVRAPADGYTLLATTTSNLLNGALYQDLKYDFVRDIAPVASLSTQALVLAAGPDVAARSVPQLIAYAKANPGKLNLAHFGNGTISHLAVEAFKLETGIDAVSVPYKGSAAMLTDLVGGRVHAAFDNIVSSAEHIRSGRLHALGVTSAARSQALPDVPTVGESVPGFQALAVAGIGAPHATPGLVVDTLNATINAGLADAELSLRLAALGASVLPGTPADFAGLIARETGKWARVIRSSGVKLI